MVYVDVHVHMLKVAEGRSRSPNVAQGPSGSIKVDPLWHVCGRSHLIIAVGPISAILRRLRLVFFGAFGEDCGWSYLINSKTGSIWQILDNCFWPYVKTIALPHNFINFETIVVGLLWSIWENCGWSCLMNFKTIGVVVLWSHLRRFRLVLSNQSWCGDSWSYVINFETTPVGPSLINFETILSILNSIDPFRSSLNKFEQVWSSLIQFDPVWTSLINLDQV